MRDIPHEIEAYPIHHLPIVRAYADKIGLGEVVNQRVPTEMEVEPGTVVLGLVLDTLSGRSPLYRLEEFFAHQDRERLLGRALPPQVFNDDNVGRVLDRLYATGTRKIVPACAVRADTLCGFETRYVHVDTTAKSVYGDYLSGDGQEVPCTITHGYSTDKRPDLKQCVLSMLCVDRAVPLWGKPEDGHASDKTRNTTLLSAIAQILAHHGVGSGASIYIADAALVTEDNRSALGDTCCISRLPATYTEGERVIQEAVRHQAWEEVGVLADTQPTKNRPVASYKAHARAVTLDGTPYRAVVVHSSAHDKRRHKRLDRKLPTAYTTLQAAARAAAKPDYFCRADAEAAAETLRAMQTDDHRVDVSVDERPQYGNGRPRMRNPREVKAMCYGLQPGVTARADRLATKRADAGCFVLLPNVPTEGAFAHGAGDVLKAYKAQHGREQNCSFLKDPLIVNSLFLKQPERLEALGLV